MPCRDSRGRMSRFNQVATHCADCSREISKKGLMPPPKKTQKNSKNNCIPIEKRESGCKKRQRRANLVPMETQSRHLGTKHHRLAHTTTVVGNNKCHRTNRQKQAEVERVGHAINREQFGKETDRVRGTRVSGASLGGTQPQHGGQQHIWTRWQPNWQRARDV